MAADLVAYLTIKIRFKFEDAFARIGNERFVLFEFEREEALGVGERLLANVIARRQAQIWFGDLDVVAEDFVVADFERANASAFTLAHFKLGEEIAATSERLAQFIKLRRKPRA